MEKKISIVIGFLVGLVFVNYEINYDFLFDLGIKPEPVWLAAKLIDPHLRPDADFRRLASDALKLISGGNTHE
ncbi:hypothetical protein [Brevibacillus sp. SAFN-007a]|uniref:hypothetical protein n=1 Tax=Brevibacillus sp. SAFN-007a TaxID=3436862 RepID=UPI003F80E376